MEISDKLCDAIQVAYLVHHAQKDKAGFDYAFHALRVGLGLLPDNDAAIVGVLHDAIEDFPFIRRAEFFRKNIRELHGDRIADAIDLLTHDKSVSYDDYILTLKSNPLARKVKLADLRDNLREDRLDAARKNGFDVDSHRAKYEAAVKVLEAK